MEKLVEQAKQLIDQSDRMVCLTGAGISTPSGIPDFRTPNSGIWANVDPFEVASIYAFQRNPQKFYNWLYPLAQLTLHAKPNSAHIALAQLERFGPLKAVITQNIDMLHTKAGSKTVYEVHGHFRQATCMDCGQSHSGEPILHQFLATRQVPYCSQCQGTIKPDVVLFGEILPWVILKHAEAAVESCDVILVAGSSLEVSPVSSMPTRAKQNGAKLIVVNLGETHLDHLADVLIHADVVDILPQLAERYLP